MADPFLGEIRIFGGQEAPRGWLKCQGQVLQTQQYQALFSLLGAQFGGNGSTTFALPNLCGQAPLGAGVTATSYPTPGLSFMQGKSGGEAAHALSTAEIPPHNHTAACATVTGQTQLANTVWSVSSDKIYAATADGAMNTGALSSTGASAAHSNMQPSIAVNFCIAVQGLYPSHS